MVQLFSEKLIIFFQKYGGYHWFPNINKEILCFKDKINFFKSILGCFHPVFKVVLSVYLLK